MTTFALSIAIVPDAWAQDNCVPDPSQEIDCDPQDNPDTEPFGDFDPELNPPEDEPIVADDETTPGTEPTVVLDPGVEPDTEEVFTPDPTDGSGSVAQQVASNVQNTPGDPVAGTPIALQSRLAGASFVNGTSVGPSPRTGGSRLNGTLSNDHLGFTLAVGRYRGPGFSARFSATPLSYVIPLEDPRWAVKIDFPIAYSVINGNKSLSASLGIGLRIPVYDHWTLTPEIRVGYTKNRTLGISAKLINLTLISNYEIPLQDGYGLTFGNSITWSRSFGSVYDLNNVILKNGVEVHRTADMRLFDLPTRWELSLVHTKVLGDPVYINEWFDISISLGTIGSKNNVTWDSFRVGVTYTKATRGVEGININFGYEF